MDPSQLTEILACPRCGTAHLRSEAGGLTCPECGEWYEAIGPTYDFFPYWEFYGPRRAQWLTWRAVEQAGARPGLSARAGARFAEACEGAERVLDLGTGASARPPVHVSRATRVVGLDARLGPADAHWTLVRGTAELLPFAEETFDVIVGDLHSVLFLRSALEQIRRCLTSGGRACLSVPVDETASEPPAWSRPSSDSRLLQVEALAKRLGTLNRFLKRHLWESLAYHPEDLAVAGVVPPERGWPRAALFDAAAAAGVTCAETNGAPGEHLFDLGKP